ncbi:MAG: DF family (seleno)protein [Solirubrobacterales bacterium]
MKVELLYFDGCPNYEALALHVRGLVKRAGVSAEVQLRRVESEEEARRLRFLGSPTVRVDDRDVEQSAEEREGYGLQCRLYRTAERVAGVPPDDWILDALRGRQA